MTIRFGSVSVLPLVAVLGLAGLGYGGYSFFCGSFCSQSNAPEATLASTTEAPVKSGACCPGDAAEVAVQTVAAVTEDGCCPESKKGAAVETVALVKEGECTGQKLVKEGQCSSQKLVKEGECTGQKSACGGNASCDDGCCGACEGKEKKSEPAVITTSGGR